MELDDVAAHRWITRNYDVSRETLAQIEAYVAEIRRWSPKINLVSRETLTTLWSRHVLDSLGLLPWVPDQGACVDLGSGAGFPALPLAILRPHIRFELIEADQRKGAFLHAVVAQIGLENVQIRIERIEAAPPRHADLVTARALAPLERLAPLALRHLVPTGRAVFPKGMRLDLELDAIAKRGGIRYQALARPTPWEGYILVVEGKYRVGRA